MLLVTRVLKIIALDPGNRMTQKRVCECGSSRHALPLRTYGAVQWWQDALPDQPCHDEKERQPHCPPPPAGAGQRLEARGNRAEHRQQALKKKKKTDLSAQRAAWSGAGEQIPPRSGLLARRAQQTLEKKRGT
ncbi:hypothetical protein NDU88_005070 [Pleurodeles waltl]|uniref:Uncharacterized protein n=1 Tax=Pleurodeles waltl TaxID=8319 RepID=A0AAV7MY62_PLEWA|nr:hypothetical protein NDU88_005070 [Pleurodeles waltl]